MHKGCISKEKIEVDRNRKRMNDRERITQIQALIVIGYVNMNVA